MEFPEETKQLIGSAKNIYIIPQEKGKADSIGAALALFYTLKELGKNVNLLIDDLPENLKFITPSLDFVFYPKNFVISIPSNIAKISQVFYEKNHEALKIHLTVESGLIKKDNLSFYFSEVKPDLIITLGIKDYAKELSARLNPYGFLLDSPILNIDNSAENKNFGKINFYRENSLSEIILNLINGLGGKMTKESAKCILSGIIEYTENFKKNVTAEIFQAASDLIKSGADIKEIIDNLKI